MEKEGGGGGGDNFFFVVFIFILVALVLTGGMEQFVQPTQNDIGQQGSSENQSNNNEQIGRDLDRIEGDLDEIEEDVEKVILFGEASPLKGLMTIGQSSASSRDVNSEYVTVYFDKKNTSKILFTGFELLSEKTGRRVTIPKGVALPFDKEAIYEEPIYLSPGDKVTINTGKSAINYSFRINKCTGYITKFHNFNPSVYNDCPRAIDENLPKYPNQLNDRCLDFLESLPRCYIPDQNMPKDLSGECVSWMTNNLTYGKCVQNHKTDKDFYTNEWRIFLGQSGELWKSSREVIKLLDLNKKTVDMISY